MQSDKRHWSNLPAPLIPRELVEWLEGKIAPKDWDHRADPRDVAHYKGKRDVVALLRQEHSRQQKGDTNVLRP